MEKSWMGAEQNSRWKKRNRNGEEPTIAQWHGKNVGKKKRNMLESSFLKRNNEIQKYNQYVDSNFID